MGIILVSAAQVFGKPSARQTIKWSMLAIPAITRKDVFIPFLQKNKLGFVNIKKGKCKPKHICLHFPPFLIKSTAGGRYCSVRWDIKGKQILCSQFYISDNWNVFHRPPSSFLNVQSRSFSIAHILLVSAWVGHIPITISALVTLGRDPGWVSTVVVGMDQEASLYTVMASKA